MPRRCLRYAGRLNSGVRSRVKAICELADFVRSNSFLACVTFRFGRQQRLQRRQCIASAPSNVTSDATLRPIPVRRHDEFCRFALRSQVLACRRLCSGARLQRTRHQGRRRLRLRLQEPRRASNSPPRAGSLFGCSGTRLRRPGCGHILRPNSSFKPKLLRSSNGVAMKACHAVACAAQFGLIRVLGLCSSTCAHHSDTVVSLHAHRTRHYPKASSHGSSRGY